MEIKSLTPPNRTLSMRFPRVQAKSNINARSEISLRACARKRTTSTTAATMPANHRGIGKEKEIAVLNAGLMKGMEFRKFA